MQNLAWYVMSLGVESQPSQHHKYIPGSATSLILRVVFMGWRMHVILRDHTGVEPPDSNIL